MFSELWYPFINNIHKCHYSIIFIQINEVFGILGELLSLECCYVQYYTNNKIIFQILPYQNIHGLRSSYMVWSRFQVNRWTGGHLFWLMLLIGWQLADFNNMAWLLAGSCYALPPWQTPLGQVSSSLLYILPATDCISCSRQAKNHYEPVDVCWV
jgi:hypothetical protein